MIGVYNYTVWLTYISFLSSLVGIYFSFNGNSFLAIICLMLSGFCDMFDGKVARMKKDRTLEEKKFGIQIDSLADLVAFGVLPSAIGYSLGVADTPLVFTLFMLPLFALIRLAYFNVTEEERSSKSTEVRSEYLGLPVTSTAIIIPVIYVLKNVLSKYFVYLYGVSLLIISILFVKKIKVIKLKTKGMIGLTVVGIIVLTLLLIINL